MPKVFFICLGLSFTPVCLGEAQVSRLDIRCQTATAAQLAASDSLNRVFYRRWHREEYRGRGELVAGARAMIQAGPPSYQNWLLVDQILSAYNSCDSALPLALEAGRHWPTCPDVHVAIKKFQHEVLERARRRNETRSRS